LRTLIEQRVKALDEFDDYDLADLITFVVIKPGDSLSTIDAVLGRSLIGGSTS